MNDSNYQLNSKNELIEIIFELLRNELLLRQQESDLDLIEIMENILIDVREEVITRLYNDILKIDDRFSEDPNVIVNQRYPTIVRNSEAKTQGPISSLDLQLRSPFTDEEVQLIERKSIGFAGFGGV